MSADRSNLRAVRIGDGPIITPASDPSLGENINGPSVIEVPEWVADPLGAFYLYFADHKGGYIRLAYAEHPTGPWTVHAPGSLQLHESHFLTEPPPVTDDELARVTARYEQALGAPLGNSVLDDITHPHIASPDVHVDHESGEIVMYFHGLASLANQQSRVAGSADGLHFVVDPKIISGTYLRAFDHGGRRYALTMPGQMWRVGPGRADMQPGPTLFTKAMRHSALLVRDDTLFVFYTVVGDAPERIVCSTIDLSASFDQWAATDPVEVLRPEYPWEGSDQPIEPSLRSVAVGQVNQLRDPAVFVHRDGSGERVFLFYAVAGESGLGCAELFGC